MLIFKGDTLLAQNNLFEFQNAPPNVVRSSLDLPGAWQDIPPWCEIGDTADVFDDSEWLDLREVWQRWGEEAFVRAGTAYQYVNWLRSARFCLSCAAPVSPRESEKALQCGGCGRVTYPPVHPAMIVAIERDGKLLLANTKSLAGNYYTVIAGFIEPGDSVERAIEREVMEETGIEVQDVRYFGSQCWPFPCSLMLAFTARWKKGEINRDEMELSDAGWFAPDEFPELPPPVSIARRLIEDFAKRVK